MEYDNTKYLVSQNQFQSKIIWEEKNIGKSRVIYKDKNKDKNQEKIPLPQIIR